MTRPLSHLHYWRKNRGNVNGQVVAAADLALGRAGNRQLSCGVNCAPHYVVAS